MNDTFGHIQGDYLLQQIAGGISSILRSADILARMGGDEFIVFLSNLDNIKQAQKIAERLCKYVHSICVEPDKKFRAAISIGIAIYLQDGTTFTELYKKSDKALYDVKHHGKNSVKRYSSIMEEA